MTVNLESVGEYSFEACVMYVKKEKYVTIFNDIKKVHNILNHKKEDQMLYAYINAGKLTPGVKKATRDIIYKCEICSKNER